MTEIAPENDFLYCHRPSFDLLFLLTSIDVSTVVDISLLERTHKRKKRLRMFSRKAIHSITKNHEKEEFISTVLHLP